MHFSKSNISNNIFIHFCFKHSKECDILKVKGEFKYGFYIAVNILFTQYYFGKLGP